MRVVVAIPTIAERPGLAEQTAERWEELTPGHDVHTVISTAGTTWAAGLNDVWSQLHIGSTDVLVCGSDDMIPHDDGWLPALLPWLEQGVYPAPRVSDPRFENWGSAAGPHIVCEDGASGDMSTFPILHGDWLGQVFPLPGDLHYFADNLIAAVLRRSGVRCVAVPSCRIVHLHAMEGRGAGYGSENTRLFIDTVRYSRALEARGIDRLSLPNGVRGHMWETHYHAQGIALGA